MVVGSIPTFALHFPPITSYRRRPPVPPSMLTRAQITELANALLDTDDELDTTIISLGMAEIAPSPNRDGLYGYDFDKRYLGTVRYYLRKWCRVYQDDISGEWRRAERRKVAATA